MKKHYLVPLTVAMMVLMASFATSAMAFPTKTTSCTAAGCHTVLDAALGVSAVAGVQGATTTPYTISVTSPYGNVAWAVFNPSGTKVAGDTTSVNAAAGGSAQLTNGVTYTIYAVGLNASSTKIAKTITVTPPVVDTTAPTTTSDAVAGYVNTAVIHLTATDNVGGSGVAHTYSILDGGAQLEGTTISTSDLATHTLQFWSVDVKGNVETTKSVQFNVHAPLPDTTAPVTTSNAVATYAGVATINLVASDGVGGSGVAHTYYILDAGSQLEGSVVTTSALGAHTLQFWSVDTSGNVETTKSANFTINAPAPATYKYVYKFNLKKKTYKKLKAVLQNKATGQKFTVTVSKKGVATFNSVPAGLYKLSTTGNKKFKFKAKTVRVGPVTV